MAELKKLKQERTQLKANLSRFKTFAERCDPTVDASVSQLRERLGKIPETWDSFMEVQGQIEALVIDKKEAIENVERDGQAQREEFEENYFEATALAKDRITVNEAAKAATAAVATPVQPATAITEQQTPVRMNIKLPSLTLPIFSGQYSQWLLFKDSFTSAINNNQSITDVQRFQYLRSSLKDEALQVIEALETSGENYKIAWDLLEAQYENRRLIVNTHLKEIIEIPSITKDNRASLGQFVNHIRKHVRALESLKLPVKQWDTILIYLATSKLDFYTRRDWESNVGVRTIETLPTLEEFLKFLADKCHMLEMIDRDKSRSNDSKPNNNNNTRKPENRVALASTVQYACWFCKGAHSIFFCTELLKLPVPARVQEVKKLHLCLNCLRKGHISKDCKASGCKHCGKQHNSILHAEQQETHQGTAQNEAHNQPEKTSSTVCAKVVKPCASQILLSTIQVDAYDSSGKLHQCRALLDPGSQSNIITRQLAKKLRLPVQSINLPIVGINQCRTNINHSTRVTIRSQYDQSIDEIECLILPVITDMIPQVQVKSSIMKIPQHLRLADETYHMPGSVDLLIGAGLFWQSLKPERISLAPNLPTLQHTKFGWILGGGIGNNQASLTACNLVTYSGLDQQLQKYWEIEEVHYGPIFSKEQEYCQYHYKNTVMRDDSDRRFIVTLPKKANVKLGDSYEGAHRRFLSLENRFIKQPDLKEEYVRFMTEYEQLGHMSLVDVSKDEPTKETYYLPHHPIVRTDHLTTKLRVVFDGSAKSDSGASLNDKLMVGPTIQDTLFDIILRFRMYQFVMTADIAMMYRQILVSDQDKDLQRVLWRTDSSEPIKVYKLNTVTYGTSSAPYLAVKCLEELALRDGSDLPLAQQALINDFYMDDLLTGTDDLEQAITLQEQMDKLMKRGNFKLRKWRANDERITSNLEEDGKTDSLLILNRHEALKTLGLLWNSQDDTLQYSVFNAGERIMTKRLILSEIAKIFDPLGLIGPVLITAKLIMQELWKQELEWDVPVSNTLHTAWSSYCNALELINDLRIPRNVKPYSTFQKFDLHGFCDASEKAYSACIYVSCTGGKGRVSTRLMCSKSKVAPLKTLSIPRLELCGALLLSRLLASVIRSLKITSNHTYLWTDSQIVLAWIRTQPYQLKTFVSNRVAEIQQLTEGADWNHVPSSSNPADLLSRGISTADLSTTDLWWHGPNWLSNQENWPAADETDNDIQVSELKTTVTMAITDDINPLLRRYSSFLKLKRVVAYCLRFVAKCKRIKCNSTLSVEELEQAEVTILKLTQHEVFSSEITHIGRGSPLHPKSKLLSLKPILGPRGIIRVGGRLQNADIPYNHQHPIILPARHHITTLILTEEHQRLLHCGPEHLLSSIRVKYWPLSGRREARKVTTRCVTCFRVRPRNMEATMANLPHARVEGFTKPFATAGVDFAGPLQIREGRRRGRIPISKGYIAVFVCFNTKAIHLELVGDLSTESFLAALNRFIARRGMCSHLYSDNGTNFVGANRELKEIYDLLTQNQTQISTQLANQKITWHFIPPRSPNFGGLWEAAVKSAKRHLYKVARNLIMTFEECYTLLTQIESVLNSRPLTPLSSNPDDLLASTPAHFLLGDSQIEPCQSDVSDISDNRLSRWQHLQKVRQHFWNRWQREYLHQLQTCTKWQQDTTNLKPGTMVLISEDNLPPLRWPLGRVLEVHPGQDGVARVATIKTATGTYQRAVRKLCALPLDMD